jgi:cytochrome c biogenesis protein CcmG/thiol:disulfide interchange protein DsbE
MTEPETDTTARRLPVQRILWVAGLLLLIGALVLVFAFALRKGDPAYDQPERLGDPLPDYVLPRLDGGGEVSLADLKGEVLVINFWASWCPPCRQEHPNLISAADVYADRGVRFIGIVYQDTDADAVSFLNTLGWGGENYLHLSDPGSRAAIGLGIFGPPETYFVDASGEIVDKIIGAAGYADLSVRLDEILGAAAAG